jgi:hypothetical protein
MTSYQRSTGSWLVVRIDQSVVAVLDDWRRWWKASQRRQVRVSCAQWQFCSTVGAHEGPAGTWRVRKFSFDSPR